MRKQKQATIIFISLVIFVTSTHAAFNYSPTLNWYTLHTEHFNVHFHDQEEALAKEVAAIAERVHDKLSPFFDWTPTEPVDIVLSDRMDFSNGSATPVPHNQMNLLVSPPNDINTLEDYDNWLELLITHEYVHILHIDKVTRAQRVLRKIFGRFLFIFPNLLQPSWLVEGLATYIETDNERGIGRGQSSNFEMLMRLETLNGIKPLRQINQPIVTWPAGSTRYLYGVYFFKFISERYGENKIKELVNFYSGNVVPFMINRTSKRILGKDLDDIWSEFNDYLSIKFNPQIETIRSQGIIEGDKITSTGYFTTHPRVLANGDLYFFQNDFKSRSVLMMLKNGIGQPIKVETINNNRFDLHPSAGILVAQLDAVNSLNIFSDLYKIDLSGKYTLQLTNGGRYTQATWSPDGKEIIAVQKALGQSHLVRLSSKGAVIETLWSGNQHENISGLDWSPDGDWLVISIWRPPGRWNLEKFTLESKQWEKLTDSESIEAQPQFSADGKSIVFTADFNGVYNIRKMLLETKQVTTLTHVMGGSFYPTLSSDQQSVYYTGADKNGFDIYKLAITKELTTPPSRPINLAQQKTTIISDQLFNDVLIETYSPIKSLKPRWWFPIALIDNNRAEMGITTNGTDALNRHQYSLAPIYDFKNKYHLGAINYVYDRWHPTFKLDAVREANIFTDNNDNLERIRLSHSVTAELVVPFIKFDYQIGLHAATVFEKNFDKKRVPGQLTIPERTDTLSGIAVTFNSARRYPLSVSLSQGRRVKLIAENSDFNGGDFSGDIYTFDWQEYLLLGNQNVLAFRLVGAKGLENPRRFSLGGNFSEALPHPLITSTDSLFNKRKYALRGYPEGLAGLRGKQMLLGAIEYRFPIKRIEYGYTAPIPIGIHQIHGLAFVNGGEAWENNSERESLRIGAGFEINTEIVLGYISGFNLRIGYAHGFNDGGKNQYYLNISTSF